MNGQADDDVKAQDCRSDMGIIVGLIDGVIAQSRIIAQYLRTESLVIGVAEALTDLRSDEDVAHVMGLS